jgi:photosystem II stability/assembly factor-like uncharacterized protein
MFKTVTLILIIILSLTAQNRWEKLNGPIGGLTTALFSDGDTLLSAFGWKGSIYFSTNGGESWIQSDIKLKRVISSFINSNNYSFLFSANEEGLYFSANLQTWSKINFSGSFSSLGRDSFKIYAGTNSGNLYSSNDHSTTWQLEASVGRRINNFILFEDSMLFAGVSGKVLRKKNNSSAWEIIDFDSINFADFTVLGDDFGNLFAVTGSRVFLSSDKGENWNYQAFLGPETMYDCVYNGRLIGAFGDETGWLGSGWGVYISNDQGVTWEISNDGLPPKISSIKLSKSGTNTYLGTNAAGVFKSTNFGESWFPINNGITAAATRDFRIGKDGTFYSASWSNGLQKSNDNGKSWIVINNGLTNVYTYSIIEDDNGDLLAGSDQGTFRSTDKGDNWTLTATVGNNFTFHLFKDNSNRIYSITFGSGIYRTTDLGFSWERVDKNFATTEIFGFAIDSSDNLYAGTRGGRIYKSTNDGNSWIQIRGSTDPSSAVGGIAIAPNGYIYAVNLYEGVLRSTDSGLTWEKKNTGITNFKLNRVVSNKKGELYSAAIDSLIFHSTDNGETWQNISGNMQFVEVRNIRFDKEDNVYLATDESVWRSNPDSVTTIVKSEDKVYQFALMQNYPNPFNPLTKIKYSIPVAQTLLSVQVQLKVYDILGKEVTVLVNKEQETGEYEVEWNASNIPSGVYFYTLRAGEFTTTKKLILLR